MTSYSTVGIMVVIVVSSIYWVMQDFYHQQYLDLNCTVNNGLYPKRRGERGHEFGYFAGPGSVQKQNACTTYLREVQGPATCGIEATCGARISDSSNGWQLI